MFTNQGMLHQREENKLALSFFLSVVFYLLSEGVIWAVKETGSQR